MIIQPLLKLHQPRCRILLRIQKRQFKSPIYTSVLPLHGKRETFERGKELRECLLNGIFLMDDKDTISRGGLRIDMQDKKEGELEEEMYVSPA